MRALSRIEGSHAQLPAEVGAVPLYRPPVPSGWHRGLCATPSRPSRLIPRFPADLTEVGERVVPSSAPPDVLSQAASQILRHGLVLLRYRARLRRNDIARLPASARGERSERSDGSLAKAVRTLRTHRSPWRQNLRQKTLLRTHLYSIVAHATCLPCLTRGGISLVARESSAATRSQGGGDPSRAAQARLAGLLRGGFRLCKGQSAQRFFRPVHGLKRLAEAVGGVRRPHDRPHGPLFMREEVLA